MKNSFLFFIFFTLTAQISFAKSYNLSSCFKSEKCLNLWDIGLRPLSPPLIQHVNRISTNERKDCDTKK
jgi:hypothetical protein